MELNENYVYHAYLSKSFTKAANILYQAPYTPSCPCGYEDCISDPAYIRWNHLKWWEELGMPTECDCAKKAQETGECRYYDDEDK